MKVKVPKKNYGITELYDAVAAAMGYGDVSKLHYDCREIEVARNIQDGFFAHYRETIPHSSETEICSIIHGLTYVDDATHFDDLDNARETVKEIQDRYKQITVCIDNIVDSLVYGNDFDPMQLHIYEVRVGWEVK